MLKKLGTSLENDRNLLFERSESVGSTVAGETQSLAIIATIASWVIIALYLWFRFKSLVYGLAAIIAVVHDVLVTLVPWRSPTGSRESRGRDISPSFSNRSRSTCR